MPLVNVSTPRPIAETHQLPKGFSVFQFGSTPFRVFVDGGEPWFIASDVCQAMTLENTTKALLRLDDDEKKILDPIQGTLNSIQGAPTDRLCLNVVSESGLYSLILGSRKEEALTFKKWVTSEVLPSIRKTGGYSLGVAKPEMTVDQKHILFMRMCTWEERNPKATREKLQYMAERTNRMAGESLWQPMPKHAGVELLPAPTAPAKKSPKKPPAEFKLTVEAV